MTFDKIQTLLELLPDTSSYFKDSVLGYSQESEYVNKFLYAYKDLMFGYRFVSTLCKENIRLPLDLEDESINKLYMFLRYKQKDNDVAFALSLNHPSSKNMEDCIKALLFTEDSYKTLSKKIGIPAKVIKFYQDYFYNVRDRKEESLMIANIVYPDTRMVEYSDSYIRNESTGNLLIRSAYNNGVDDSMYLMGLKTESDVFAGEITASDSAAQLETSIMANGLFLARNGFINQRSSAGVANAKNMLIAAKQSGIDAAANNTDIPIGDAMWQALKDIKGPEIDKKLSLIEQNELAKLDKK